MSKTLCLQREIAALHHASSVIPFRAGGRSKRKNSDVVKELLYRFMTKLPQAQMFPLGCHREEPSA